VNIEIKLAKDSEVQVEVLNQLGQKVKIITSKQIMPGGLHKLTWNGRNENNSQVSPGIYHLRTEIDNSVIINKVVLSK
jgi:flagellar hook assembly protein FlgD